MKQQPIGSQLQEPGARQKNGNIAVAKPKWRS
jgi:hypothetical protein